MTIYCGCTSDKKGNTAAANYQDNVYGKGKRVHTPSGKTNNATCTVCGTTRNQVKEEAQPDAKQPRKGGLRAKAFKIEEEVKTTAESRSNIKDNKAPAKDTKPTKDNGKDNKKGGKKK